eukprot:TRINITY_DN14148_c0_g1_i1.p1 TRINITY_DN14148_c0_g1~~TRINITY_DN14148_c0_g1_i1.p1  ORF type:complete len:514 (+),score=56.46 TRINITY_DN14148_c0_g1_i1:108-1649(+)
MASFKQAMIDGLMYSKFVWSHVFIVVFPGALIGVIPLAVCLRLSAQSLVAKNGMPVPLSPHDWSGEEASRVDFGAFAMLWILKYFWCTLAEFMPFWLALVGNDASSRQRACCLPLMLAVGGTVIMGFSSAVPTIYESTGNTIQGSFHYWYEQIRHIPNIAVNTFSMVWCCPPGTRLKSIFPAMCLALMCPILHHVIDPCVDLYLENNTWYIRMGLCFLIMSGMRPLLIQFAVFFMNYVPSLSSVASRTRVVAYVSIACGAAVHVLQVSADGFFQTTIVYLSMMMGEFFRSTVLLAGDTEFQHSFKRLTRVSGAMRRTLTKDKLSAVTPIEVVPCAGNDGGKSEVSVVPVAHGSTRGADVEDDGQTATEVDDNTKAVMNELVATCNIMEGALIFWIPLLIYLTHMNPYDFGGEALSGDIIWGNAGIGLLVEVLTDFACYAGASYFQILAVRRADLEERVGISIKRTCSGHLIPFVGLFIIVLSMSLESVGHLWEGLCLTGDKATGAFASLTVCV